MAVSENSKILRFPHKTCIGCGGLFLPYCSWHAVCRDCWHWHRALTGIETTRRALRELRR